MQCINVLLVLFALQLLACCEAANILLVPALNASHFLEVDGVARPLHQRGHKIYVLFNEGIMMPKGAPYELITFPSPSSGRFDLSVLFNAKSMEKSDSGMNLTQIFEIMKMMCSDMMADADLFVRLQSLKLDLVILDNGPSPCYYLVPYRLGVPFVAVGTVLLSWNARVPILPSVVQSNLDLSAVGIHFCEEHDNQYSIVKRFCRMITVLLPEVFFANIESDYLRQFVDFPSINAIRDNASLTLVNLGHLLSTPLPKLPNVEYVGGLTTKPPKPLEAGLENWMSQAANVVIVSFGSMYGSLPPTIATKLFEAFGKLNQFRFLFRFKQSEVKSLNVPVNVRLMDWLPQNDALGHNSTVAFVTHSGNNGQQEALYHGVPMLCFYIHGDQKSNAKRVVQRGYGKMINIHDFTVDQVVAELSDLVHNPSFTQRIKKASRIFHSEKHPSERAADAVEHVLKYGSEHLRSKEAYSLSWWQFYMLDVLAILYTVLLLLALAVYKVAKCLMCWLLSGRSRAKNKLD